MYPFLIKSFGELTASELHRLTEAREEVFYLEQHVTCPDADSADLRSTFLWAEEAGRVVAFLRMIPAGVLYPEASIGRVLVVASHRRKGLCRTMVQEAIHYMTSKWGAHSIRISAQEYLTPFYASLGFEPVSECYLEAGIPHVKMLKRELRSDEPHHTEAIHVSSTNSSSE